MVEGIDAYVYIYHLGVKFNLPTLPESLNESMGINFSQQPILSRSAPLITFSDAGPRTTQVEMTLHRQLFSLENDLITREINGSPRKLVKLPDPLTGAMQEVVIEDAVDYLINAILSLSVPKYLDSTKSIVPPSLLIRYGNETAIRGVPQNVQKTASGVWLKNGKKAEVKLSFGVIETEPYSAQYVAKNGSLRAISTTLERSSVWQY